MSRLLQRLMTVYCAPNTEGKDLGGGDSSSADRGDEWPLSDASDTTAEGDGDGDGAETELDPGEGEEEPAEEGEEEEPEEEGEEEAEEEEAETATAEKRKGKGKEKDIRIPKARLDQELEKNRNLRKQVETLERERESAKAQDKTADKARGLEETIAALEAEYEAFMADGATDKAAAKTKAIRLAERQLNELNSHTMSERARSTIKEELRVETMIESFTERYDAVNPDSDEYDQDVVDQIEGLRSLYEGRGMRASDALKDAFEKVMRRNEPAEQAPAKGLSSTPSADTRKQAALNKALDAKAKQPARQVAGKDSDKKGGSYEADKLVLLNDEEWDKLPDDVIRKARGDFA